MNTGVISSRYARTLLKFTEETSAGSRVCAEAESLLGQFASVPDLSVLTSGGNALAPGQAVSVLKTALGGSMSEELEKFLSLVERNGRMEYIVLILRTFVDLYRQSRGVRMASLVTAVPPTEELIASLEKIIKDKTGCSSVVFRTRVDPSVIGGFVLDIGDYRMDGSIASQLEQIRRQLMDRNRRIV